jgi:homoserine dehydrogenase
MENTIVSEKLRVGIAGLGTVGGGVVKVLAKQADLLAKRCGREIVVTAVSSRSREKDRGFVLDSNITWYDDAISIASDENVDVVVELIGGDSGVALELCEKSLNAGKHFVTANKAMIAKHGTRLAQIAEKKNVALSFEAAVAGGIPIIKALKEGLAGNACSRISGIMNGTCNYILTTMKEEERDFAEVLKEAQDLGYAEADPSFDVDGIDTAHKLAILASIAFGAPADFDAIYIEGIRKITLLDIKYAYEMNYKIKLLGIAIANDNGIEQHIYPCLVPINHPLSKVDGVNNAVFIEGDSIGKLLLEGPGAGELATASAVVADIADIAASRFSYPFGMPVESLQEYKNIDFNQHEGEYYLRITVRDEAGVLAGISDILKDAGISIESLVQKPVKKGQDVNIVVITHICSENSINKAMEKIVEINGVVGKPGVLRIES